MKYENKWWKEEEMKMKMIIMKKINIMKNNNN